MEKKTQFFTTAWVLPLHCIQITVESRERGSRCSQHKHGEGPTPGFEIPCPQPPLLYHLVAAAATSSDSHGQLHSPRKGPKPEISDCLWRLAVGQDSGRLRACLKTGLRLDKGKLLHFAIWRKARKSTRKHPLLLHQAHCPGPHRLPVICTIAIFHFIGSQNSYHLMFLLIYFTWNFKSSDKIEVEKDPDCSHTFTMLSV